jgi:hypothetical protein
MPSQPGAVINTQGFGNRPENVEVPHLDVRAPGLTDIRFPIGKTWVDTIHGNYYVLCNFNTSAGVTTANWAFLGATSGDLDSLTTDDTTVVTPTAGTIIFTGNATQGTSTSGSNGPGTVVVTVADATSSQKGVLETSTNAEAVTGTAADVAVTPAALTARLAAPGAIGGTTPGAGTFTSVTATTGAITATLGAVSAGTSVSAGTTITATLGNITATNGNLVLVAAGNKINRTSVATTTTAGANSIGSVVLVGGTATVSTTSVTTNSLIKIWRQTVGATGAAALGELSVGTITNGTSFVINAWQQADATALQASDVSVIGWEIVN